MFVFMWSWLRVHVIVSETLVSFNTPELACSSSVLFVLTTVSESTHLEEVPFEGGVLSHFTLPKVPIVSSEKSVKIKNDKIQKKKTLTRVGLMNQSKPVFNAHISFKMFSSRCFS